MSDEYLNKVRVGLRRSTLTTELEMELSDIIEQFVGSLVLTATTPKETTKSISKWQIT